MKSVQKLTLIILLLITASCREKVQLITPDVGVPQEYMNTHIKLTAPYGTNSFHLNDPISIFMETQLDKAIIFPNDLGMRVFLRSDESWIELQEIPTINSDGTMNETDIGLVPTFYSEGPQYLFPKGVMPDTIVAEPYPFFPKTIKSAYVRIVFVGHIYENRQATEQTVGAYIDISLSKR